YQPCPPEQLRAQVAALELRYRDLSALSGQRRLRLERSRRLWKFLWDAGEEEAWLREQERLLRCPELGRDLPGALRMLSQLEAIRGALGGRAAPLERLLERGRELLELGDAEEAAGAAGGAVGSGGTVESTAGVMGPATGSMGSAAGAAGSVEITSGSVGSAAGAAGSVEITPGSVGSAPGAAGSVEIMELTPGSVGSTTGAGGSVEITPGSVGSAPGAAGSVEITPGSGGSTTGAGGSVEPLELTPGPVGSAAGAGGSVELTPGSVGSAAGAGGSVEPVELTPGPVGPPSRAAAAEAASVEAAGGSGAPPEPVPSVSRRLRALRALWSALPALARERERRLRAAVGRFQVASEAAEAEAWLAAACRRLAGPEKDDADDDERSAGVLERRLRELQDELRRRGTALAGLREQAGPGEPGEPDVVPGLPARLEELERRHRELEARAEARRTELRDLLALLAARGEADACALWVGEREQWLLSMEIPERIEDLEVVQQRFETLEPELAALGARVAAVGRAAEELQGSGERTRERARDTWEQLRDRWERFRALAERKKAALTSALDIQNFRLECDETRGWMREKAAAIEATRAPGRDLAGLAALQRRLSGLGRDLEAIEGKQRELRAQGERLAREQPERGPEARERLEALEAEWAALSRCLRGRRDALGQARRLQAFLRDLAALRAWLARARAAAGSEDVPASLAEAEGSLRRHESLRTEIAQYGADYRSARAAGRELSQGRSDPQGLSLLQRLDALDADWEELGRSWERRQQLLARALAVHVFLRDAKQVEGTLGKQEHALALTELPCSVPGAEAAVRRLEEVLVAMEAGAERVRALSDTGRRLLAEGGVHAEKVRETVESVESRHQKNRESAQELLGRLRDNWELQKFLQDAQELTLWLNEKLPVARDVSYEGARDLQGKWQKHQAFVAELAANRGWLEALEKDGQQLAGSRPSLSGQVTGPLGALRALWARVEAMDGQQLAGSRPSLSGQVTGPLGALWAVWDGQQLAGSRPSLLGQDGQQLVGSRPSLLGQDGQQLAGSRPSLSGQVTGPLGALRALWARVEAMVPSVPDGQQLAGSRPSLSGQDGQQLAGSRPSLSGQVTGPLGALRALWARVEAAAGAKGRGLAEAARAEGCAQACAGLRSWLAGVRAQLRSGHCGHDLTSVGVLLTRPQTLQKELQGRERRVAELLERVVPEVPGVPGVAEGGPGGVPALREAWRELRAEVTRRQRRLEAALAAQRFLGDAAAAEAWLGERELHMLAQDKAKDEPGAQAMLSRHLGLEQELRDYGRTVELLLQQGRDMAASGHPDSDRLRARAAQVQRLYAGLCQLAGERRAALQGHHRLCQLRRDMDDLEQWIAEREVVAASRELGQDYEHVTHIPYLSQVSQVQEAAGRLAAAYAGPRAEELRAQERLVSAAWAELRGRCQRRRRLLGDTVEQFRFLRAARDLRLWMDGMNLQLEARERPRDVTAAELLIQ
ncbi:PREDICTED: spectrin beta chain, non-erythrocytic 2-like, partial [Lepidothrix coronata]|uniref:Spectrin beta chain, non-erythrocytic 2-like n=1 Tax=Lepidothrix coronata TaxID=321398 RepID=A0A6J0J971_9PASS